MKAPYREIAELLLQKRQCVALTDAGISAESGIPTFRSKGGLWEKYDPMVYASAEAFRQDPSKYCKSMLVVGTSAVVQPAASLPYVAKQNGALVIEINPEKSFSEADYYIEEKAGPALSAIVAEVPSLKQSAIRPHMSSGDILGN